MFVIVIIWASLVAQLVKNLPAMWETWVWSLGWEDPLEKGMAAHSSILAWRIPWTIVHGVRKSWTRLSDFHFHYYLFLLGWILVTAHWIFTFNMWDLVPWPGIEPRLHALGEQSWAMDHQGSPAHLFKMVLLPVTEVTWCTLIFFWSFSFRTGCSLTWEHTLGVQWTDSCWHNAIRGSLHQNLNQATIS